ncbi:DUF2076 domain-containing protein [Prosthecomicrobium pneumaticum]|uniref:ABC transporter substrate-binding protein n=1 Tax=Prosthecomicrobium pneumaticum TaxID=81895 RepID=A0A7W9FKR4_9HYPH|nr:DUF2076 domain-containing protein [Prosthecomicrobium pneumaticum]MBB5751363.1 hypothetical protein [Prosthecomicrobium pneumaticum]
MDNQDRQAIEGLFARLEAVERQSAPRDADAEALIGECVARQPAAPYLMAQTIVMQDVALRDAEERIAALERQVSERPAAGGLFSSLFGGGRPAPAPLSARVAPRAAADEPPVTARGGGGFLAGAAQTAMGVAGGVLLGNAIAGMFSGGEANAAEPSAAETAEPEAAPAAEEEGGFFDGFFGGDEEL